MYYVTLNDVRYPFEDFVNGLLGAQPSKTTPYKGDISPSADVDIFQDRIVIKYEMPGVDPDDISVKLEKNNLIVSGTKKRSTSLLNQLDIPSDKRHEIIYGKYTRVFTLGEDYQSEVQATYDNGILNVEIKRKPETTPKVFKVTRATKQLEA